jgi:hypothetical protein
MTLGTSDETPRRALIRWLFLIAATLALVFYPRVVSAGTIRLAWDPVVDPDLAGYRIYYGTTSGAYTQTATVGKQTTADLTNLQDCVIYYLALKAVDANGNESVGYSNEISGMAAPIPSTVSPASAKQGTANLNLVITGTNFDTQARPDFGPDIVVNTFASISCSRIEASVSLDEAARVNSAPATPRVIAVVNQGGPRGTRTGAFTVTFDERRADIDGSGRVLGRDLLYWRNAFGSVTGESAYNPDADLNGDGIVDGADLALLAIWHGTTFF